MSRAESGRVDPSAPIGLRPSPVAFPPVSCAIVRFLSDTGLISVYRFVILCYRLRSLIALEPVATVATPVRRFERNGRLSPMKPVGGVCPTGGSSSVSRDGSDARNRSHVQHPERGRKSLGTYRGEDDAIDVAQGWRPKGGRLGRLGTGEDRRRDLLPDSPAVVIPRAYAVA